MSALKPPTLPRASHWPAHALCASPWACLAKTPDRPCVSCAASDRAARLKRERAAEIERLENLLDAERKAHAIRLDQRDGWRNLSIRLGVVVTVLVFVLIVLRARPW